MLLVSAILLGTGSVWAQSPPPEAQDKGNRKGHRDSLPDSVRRVERQTGGEVLRAEPMQRDGREVYRLKVLTADGRVRVMQEDPSDPPARQRSERGRDKQKASSEGSDEESPP